jgi:hypothetical protein
MKRFAPNLTGRLNAWLAAGWSGERRKALARGDDASPSAAPSAAT